MQCQRCGSQRLDSAACCQSCGLCAHTVVVPGCREIWNANADTALVEAACRRLGCSREDLLGRIGCLVECHRNWCSLMGIDSPIPAAGEGK